MKTLLALATASLFNLQSGAGLLMVHAADIYEESPRLRMEIEPRVRIRPPAVEIAPPVELEILPPVEYYDPPPVFFGRPYPGFWGGQRFWRHNHGFHHYGWHR